MYLFIYLFIMVETSFSAYQYQRLFMQEQKNNNKSNLQKYNVIQLNNTNW